MTTSLDIKLMNITASVLQLVFGLLSLGALAAWFFQNPVFALRGNWVRSALTSLGVIIGIAAVITTMSLRRSASLG